MQALSAGAASEFNVTVGMKEMLSSHPGVHAQVSWEKRRLSEQLLMPYGGTFAHENVRDFWSLRVLESLSFDDLTRRLKDANPVRSIFEAAERESYVILRSFEWAFPRIVP